MAIAIKSRNVINKFFTSSNHLVVFSRATSSRPTEPIFVEKVLEAPVILQPSITKKLDAPVTLSPPPRSVLQNEKEEPVIIVAETDHIDLIGPPDPVSNLRPVLRSHLFNETALQTRLREMQNATQDWNQKFWSSHNRKFILEKETYIQSHQIPGEGRKQLNADEMSEFYKIFLDKNWETHVKYNMEWYKRNFFLVFLALRVSIERKLLKLL